MMILSGILIYFCLTAIPLFFFRLRINLLEIFAYLPLIFVLENELINVFSLNLEFFKGKGTVGDWILITYLMFALPVTFAYLLHFFYLIPMKLLKGLLIVTMGMILTVAEYGVFYTDEVVVKNWPFVFSMIHIFSLIAVLIPFSYLFRKMIRKLRGEYHVRDIRKV